MRGGGGQPARDKKEVTERGKEYSERIKETGTRLQIREIH